MAKSRTFDADLAALDFLRDAPPAQTLEPLRKALAHKNNFLVAKAAKLAVAQNQTALLADLAAAFPRFLIDAVKTDPQCWAKNALASALAHFDYQEPGPFLAGIRHVQLEPVWGGSSDTAGPLRSTCALALVNCRTLSSRDVLAHLLPLFADPELAVQVNVARAVEQIGSDSAALLLRLRAELASASPELLGACYSGVLRLEGPRALSWAASFLHPATPDDTSAEAAFAIAETRTEAAATLLLETHHATRDATFRDTLLTAMALTRQPGAIEFLFTLAAEGNRAAREALASTAPSPATLARLQAL